MRATSAERVGRARAQVAVKKLLDQVLNARNRRLLTRETRSDSAFCRRAAHSQVLRAGVRRRSMNSRMVCMPSMRDSWMS